MTRPSEAILYGATACFILFYFAYTSLGLSVFLVGAAERDGASDNLPLVAAAMAFAGAVVAFDRSVVARVDADLQRLAVPARDQADLDSVVVQAVLHPVGRRRWGPFIARSLVAFLVACVLAQTIDAWFFHQQIQQQLSQIHSADLANEIKKPTGAIQTLQAKIDANRYEQDTLKREDAASVSEMNQTRREAVRARSRRRGHLVCATACRKHMAAARRLSHAIQARRRETQPRRRALKTSTATYAARQKAIQADLERRVYKNEGGLADTKALFQYLGTDVGALIQFVLITILLIAFDLAALMFKYGSHGNVYERRQALRTRLEWLNTALPKVDVVLQGFLELETRRRGFDLARVVGREASKAVADDPSVKVKAATDLREAVLERMGGSAPDSQPPLHVVDVDREHRSADDDSDSDAESRRSPWVVRQPRGPFRLRTRSVAIAAGAELVGRRHRWVLDQRIPQRTRHGELWLAREAERLRRPAVIKIMPMPAAADPAGDALRRGTLTALTRATQLPSHSHITPTLDSFVSPRVDFAWLAMPYRPERSLAEFYGQVERSVRPLRQIVNIAMQVADGLEAAARGSGADIVHLDLKPANLLVREIQDRDSPRGQQPIIEICDWVLSRPANELSPGGGTLWFSSPEALAGGSLADPRDDLYSLGATLWALCTSMPPYFHDVGPAPTADDLRASSLARQEHPRGLDNLAFWFPAAPAELAALVNRLLAYDRSARAPQGAEPRRWVREQLERVYLRLAEQARRGGEVMVGWEARAPNIDAAIDTGTTQPHVRRAAPTEDPRGPRAG